jgi:hypothetical protein
VRSAVVLFTRDLRVHDNPALAAAAREAELACWQHRSGAPGCSVRRSTISTARFGGSAPASSSATETSSRRR